MAFFSSLWSGFISLMLMLWELFTYWLFVFISPYKNFDVLWIIIPVWVAWIFADYFQEKSSTSFGNAISNGIVPVFVALD